jgi:hypothetical protein
MQPQSDMLDDVMWGLVILYFWPYFVAGQLDNWKELASLKPFRVN